MSVVILDSSGNQIKKFYQWDYNISIKIVGVNIPTGMDPPKINFASGSCDAAIPVTPDVSTPGGVTTLTAAVPNGLLTRPEAMRIFFYTNMGADEHRTTYETTIPVMPRQMPSDYEGGGGGTSIVEVKPLVVSANGHYPTRVGTAWSPVTVNVDCDYYDSDEVMLPYYRYIVDTTSDLSQIEDPEFGTIAYCIEDGCRYIAQSNGDFVVMRNNYY